MHLLRDYWGIENGSHYRRDITLHEYTTRTTVGHVKHNLAKARRFFDAHLDQALALVTHE
jgi:hypothetical protein